MLIKNEYKPQMLPKQPKGKKPSSSNERMMLVLGGLALAFSALIFRGVYIQTSEHAFLKDQGDRRFVRTLALPASRGTITDRNGATLALSAPTESLYAIPSAMDELPSHEQLVKLAKLTGVSEGELEEKLVKKDKDFIYLKRKMYKEVEDQIEGLGIKGL